MGPPYLFDAHVHCWAPAGDERYPHKSPMLGAGGTLPAGDPASLLAALDAAHVAGAVVVQPACYGFDHSYVEAVVAASRGRLVGCALANPTLAPEDGAAEVRRLVRERGFRAIRLNPYLWPDGRTMADAAGMELCAAAGEAGVPVCVMAFKGLHLHADDVAALAAACPGTRLVIDHLGFVPPPGTEGHAAELGHLTALARFPNVWVKASAFFRLSATPWPHADAAPTLRAAVDAYGAGRVVWGTDWPWVTGAESYGDAWRVAARAGLAPHEAEWVCGKAAADLFGLGKGAWAEGGA